MSDQHSSRAAATRAEIVVPAGDLDASLAFFSGLGFALESTFPAESPRVAVISGHGLRLRLDVDARTPPGHIVLHCDSPHARELTAPSGMRVELTPHAPAPVIPPLVPSYVLSRLVTSSSFTAGRAGMRYRDLIPGRQGGRFIASHIVLGQGGKVSDYVHFHKVRFQMIFCWRGWTRLLYEGEPELVMKAGECVLQPPEIRHRVLECGPGTEVVEIGCPALHETFADPACELPSRVDSPRREFGGQTFLHHDISKATWQPSRVPGFRARDLGVAAATRGLADAHVLQRLQSSDVSALARRVHDGELLFDFVLEGSATLTCEGHAPSPLAPGDAFVIPAGVPFALEDRSTDLEVFELVIPQPKRSDRAD